MNATQAAAPDGGQAEHAHATRRGDTRARIQQVALELFAEQGYERTSLREIAERLAVTKAALYYHFKSKEDIVRSFTEDYFGRLDALIEWGREQPPGPQTAQELLDRYITIVMESGEVFRFLERNQATIRGTEDGKHRFTQFRPRLAALMEVITGPDAPLRSRIRAAAAIFAVSASCMFFMKDAPEADLDALLPAPPSPDELHDIVLEFATELTRPRLRARWQKSPSYRTRKLGISPGGTTPRANALILPLLASNFLRGRKIRAFVPPDVRRRAPHDERRGAIASGRATWPTTEERRRTPDVPLPGRIRLVS